MTKQKLELTWIGKSVRPKLEPRILLEDPTKSYHAKHRISENDLFDNRLIFGDNLLALKALEHDFAGQVKCVYIDPPFNTQQAFEHYDDGVEHSVWLSLMRDRLEVIYRLMSVDGSLFVHIDDNELGYLIALLDEIFGRSNRVSIVTFKQSSASGPKAINPGLVTTNNFLLYYVKDKSAWTPNRVFVPTVRDDRYSKCIENFDAPYAEWRLVGLRDAFLRSTSLQSWDDAKKKYMDKLEERLTQFVLANAERVVRTARVAPKDVNESAREALSASLVNTGTVHRSVREGKENYYFINGEQLIFYKAKTKEIDGRVCTASPLTNLWDDLLSNNLHNEGGVAFPNGKKPESLIKRCLELSTKQGDLVLDSFAGSGTTGAVAHKMKRRWILVELGDHCDTHVLPRLRRVVDGEDVSGITKAVGWKGGGGFRYYRLAPSLLQQDRWGQWVVNREYNPVMLAEAICKLEGFTYDPNDAHYWMHGHSSECDFIYVTTQSLNADQLQALSDEVGMERSLLVCCSAFRGDANRYPNLTLKKIPKMVLKRCEWAHDDYSLNVRNLPLAKLETPEPEAVPKKITKEIKNQASLFDGGDE
ncbi:site-specific DNA-methyltransferase [Noviherbaspirillum sp.]|uniref:site-specific DNA-methyltransferase n=1 Tax=Noviherbaspirillum sp. TaxID=1926288 RepID=UPI002B49FD4D|nr:site-specific DNA-methyltransferase [Noviherbaspirillum sp.]HJV81331.1 site-specific DNA-methyltransferase [Noviherbaspirillum sp.]